MFPDVYTNIVLKNSGNAIKFIQIAGWYYENDGDETSKQYMIVFAYREGLDELTKAKSLSIDGTFASFNKKPKSRIFGLRLIIFKKYYVMV